MDRQAIRILTPVSYTHLDVYKRQPIIIIMTEIIKKVPLEA